MHVPVRVNQVGVFEQNLILKYRSWCALSDHGAILKHEAMIRYVLDDIEVVSGRNDRLDTTSPTDKEIDQLALAFWIQCRRGLVKKQDLRVKNQNRGECYSFLFAPGKPVRRAGIYIRYIHHNKAIRDQPANFILW